MYLPDDPILWLDRTYIWSPLWRGGFMVARIDDRNSIPRYRIYDYSGEEGIFDECDLLPRLTLEFRA